MWNNILFQFLLLFMIFAMIHAIYIKFDEPEKKIVKEKLSNNIRSVQFADEPSIHNYNPDTVIPQMDDSFLYEDSAEPEFAHSRSNEGQTFSEYPDNCNDNRTIAELHDEFVGRSITIDMDRGDVDGVYKGGQYNIDDNITDMGYTDFATY